MLWILNSELSSSYTIQFAQSFGSFVFLVTGNLVYKRQFMCWDLGRDGSRVPRQVRGLKTTWSGKLNDSLVIQQPSTSTTKLKEGIVGVDGTSNRAVNR